VTATNSIDLDRDPRSIVGTRVFDAPRELVFAAFTDPTHLAQWWGPDGFTTTTSRFEFRKGGVWRFVMHGPDGRDYQNLITFDEIIAPERIAYRHGGADDPRKRERKGHARKSPQRSIAKIGRGFEQPRAKFRRIAIRLERNQPHQRFAP